MTKIEKTGNNEENQEKCPKENEEKSTKTDTKQNFKKSHVSLGEGRGLSQISSGGGGGGSGTENRQKHLMNFCERPFFA